MDRRIGIKGAEGEGEVDAIGDVFHLAFGGSALHRHIADIGQVVGGEGDAVRNSLLRGYGIEIGRGLGEFAGKVWRVGLMGESSKPEYVLALLSAMEKILPEHGYEVASGVAVAAASESLGRG